MSVRDALSEALVICAEPALCAVCSIYQRPEESRAAWLARLSAMAAVSLDLCRNGHPWQATTTRVNRQGFRVCIPCERDATRRSRAAKKAAP